MSGIGIWTQAAGFQSECCLHSLKPDPGGEGGQRDVIPTNEKAEWDTSPNSWIRNPSFAQFEWWEPHLKSYLGSVFTGLLVNPTIPLGPFPVGTAEIVFKKDPWPYCGATGSRTGRKLLSFYPSQPTPGGRQPMWAFCLDTKSCLSVCGPTDYTPLAFFVHEILQARILEWIAMPLLQEIFPTQGSNLNPSLLHSQGDSSLRPLESPKQVLAKC